MRLDSVEDFERAVDALVNPHAKPFKYLFQPYGYCPIERKVTPYQGDFGPEGVVIFCLSCRNLFSDTATTLSEASYLYGNLIPQRYAKEIGELHMRENQAKELWRFARERRSEFGSQTVKLKLELRDMEQDIKQLDVVILTVLKICNFRKN